MTNKEIVDIYIENGLIQKCVSMQFAKVKEKSVRQFQDDFLSDLVILLYEYENDKLLDAHINNHFNALVTSIIVKQVWSNTSPFYLKYRKFMDKSDDITKEIEETYGY